MSRRTHDAAGDESEHSLEETIEQEIELGQSPNRPIRRRMRRLRDWARAHPRFRRVYLVIVALVGVSISVVGLALVPLPGPGWLIVFLGLAILGTEFHWAKRLTTWAKGKIERFWRWWNARRAARAAQRSS